MDLDIRYPATLAAGEAPSGGGKAIVRSARYRQIFQPEAGNSLGPASASPTGKAAAPAADVRLAKLTASFRSDFVNGVMGTRFNTHAHRARVLRRVAAEREA